jgi:hypothetical protein
MLIPVMIRETPGLLQRGRSGARSNARLHAFDSEDDMDDFFDSDEHSPDSGEQGPQGRTESSGNTDNTHGIQFPCNLDCACS